MNMRALAFVFQSSVSQGSANLGAFCPPLRAPWGFPLSSSSLVLPAPSPRARSLGTLEVASSWVLGVPPPPLPSPLFLLGPASSVPRVGLLGILLVPVSPRLGLLLFLSCLVSGRAGGGCPGSRPFFPPLCLGALSCFPPRGSLSLFSLWFWGPRPKDSCGLGLLGYDLWSMIFDP